MLETRYGATRSAAIDRKRLKECRREKGETYADLGQDILRLARQVYKTAPDLALTLLELCLLTLFYFWLIHPPDLLDLIEILISVQNDTQLID